jgi:hypothetical protein
MPQVARALGVELTDEETNLEQWARETRGLVSDGFEGPVGQE